MGADGVVLLLAILQSCVVVVEPQANVAVSQDGRGRGGGTIRCHVRNQYMARDDPNTFYCPSVTGFAATQCFKLLCMGTSSSPNPFYIQKGCLDTSNVGTATCEYLVGLCNGLGGGARGMCYTCAHDQCNKAPVTAMNKHLMIVPLVLSLLFSTVL